MSKVILVTGANAGIGFELVQLLAEKGHVVYVGARNPVSGKEAVEKLTANGLKNVKFVEIDVNKTSTITAASKSIESAEGKLDVLVNNAGIANFQKDQNALTIDVSTIRETMETNLYGLIETSKTFVPLLRKSTTGAPVILNVSTDMASNWLQSQPNSVLHVVAYNTSKAAANSYTIALANELKKEGFKINAVTPGFTSTKLNGFRDGGKSTRDGALALLPWALLDKEGGTGLFIDEHQKELKW
ncbi:hypothetical protein CPB83DRAFT_850044 [Crepidotus variabilis]|uniref:NAD(P)-binding protein n=1 Tax=Crepidotus variabilis TaxID=179855 RepID=A0A9P6EJS3_9AGAR|nr:hypothetical protein CPB83DRAFT_850044 [Crepidotus variabilis]